LEKLDFGCYVGGVSTIVATRNGSLKWGCVVVEAGCNWYLLNINIYFIEKEKTAFSSNHSMVVLANARAISRNVKNICIAHLHYTNLYYAFRDKMVL
jgi:hypothetical protein